MLIIDMDGLAKYAADRKVVANQYLAQIPDLIHL